MKTLVKILDGISEWVGRIVSYLLVIIIVITFYEVVVRYFFQSPTSWSNELAQILFAIYSMLGGAYVLKHHAHIRMDIFSSKFSARTSALVDILTCFLAISFLFVLTWKGGIKAYNTILTNEHATTVWAPSMIPFRLSLPVGCALFLLQVISELIKDFIILVKGEAYLDS